MQNFTKRDNRHDNRSRYVYYARDLGKTPKVELSHRDGGYNYFSGESEARGIEVSVSMVEVGASGTPGCTVETYAPADNCNARFLVLEVARYNKAKMERIANAIDQDLPRLTQAWEQDTASGKALLVEIAQRAAQAA